MEWREGEREKLTETNEYDKFDFSANIFFFLEIGAI